MGEWIYRPTFYLTSVVLAGEWSASRFGRFTLGKRAPGAKSPRCPLDRRLDGSQSRYGRHGEVKILARIGTRTPDYLVVQPVAIRYTD
jgi:hypothetical protein